MWITLEPVTTEPLPAVTATGQGESPGPHAPRRHPVSGPARRNRADPRRRCTCHTRWPRPFTRSGPFSHVRTRYRARHARPDVRQVRAPRIVGTRELLR
jgi:hypothetical protein